MIDYKARFQKVLSNHRGTPFVFSYWDATTQQFGTGAPRFIIHFKTRDALKRSLLETSLGFGEAYARGDVIVEGDLTEALTALGEAYLAMGPEHLLSSWTRKALARTLPREKADIEHHYGLGNRFFELFLDPKLTYSCAYFRTPDDALDLAQEQKIAHTTRKLHLQPGQRLLDIGCGWGHLMFHAAETYGVQCLGITLCDNQANYIREEAARRRLPVEVRTTHYLKLDESTKWDRIVSVGMMCHIGESRANQYFDKVKSLLAPGAVCLLHCIAKMKESSGADPFVEKHVFPGYWFFSLEGMTRRAVARGLNIIDVENLRRHYALTLNHWRANFLRNYEEIKAAMGYDDRFMRTWEFYLASAEAGFHTGHLNLIQMVMTNGVVNDYPWTREFLYQASPEYALVGG
ncbi:MAG: class I SAM-dependent methyltransferase [Acidobacteria bacterium]|nr:class I SAM-dependent methyltransferase [Acidobacteriota bacterium]